MFFTLAKLFSLVADPSHFGLILLVVGVALLFTPYRHASKWVLLPVALGGLSLLGPDQWLAQPLENRFPREPQLCQIDGIIMLGGGEEPKLSRARDQAILRERSGKYFAALSLLRRFPAAKLVVAAGSGEWDPDGTRETDVASAVFAEAGVPADRLILDSTSRDTFENFRNAKALVAPKPGERWVLLTSAMHMPRSVAIAREIGFPVIPWPTDYRTLPAELALANNLGGSLGVLDAATHEWAGFVGYWLTGRIATLLPEPEAIDGGCTPSAAAPA